MAPTFEALALSMTTAIRSNEFYPEGLRPVAVSVTKEIPLIQVRWAWISLPLILQVAVLILLCYTIERTSRQRLPIWKNSTVATIILGVRAHSYLRQELSSDKLIDLKSTMENVEIGCCQLFTTDHAHKFRQRWKGND